MGKAKIALAASVAALALFASACSIDVERNADGSLGVAAVMTEESLETEIERDPQNESVELEITDGYVLAEVARIERDGRRALVTFRADIGLQDGDLVVAVSDAEYDGFPIPQSFVQVWNEELARALRTAANQHPDAALLSITVDDGQIATEWRLETPESQETG
jgi:hypothetical protein